MKKHFLIVVLVLGVIVSCTKTSVVGNNNTDNNIACTGTKLFSSDVNPIIQNVCTNSDCHNAGSTNGPGPLITYQQVFNARATIRSAIANGTMPKNTTLSASQKNAIVCWIDNGAINN